MSEFNELSAIAFEKREKYRTLGMINMPLGYEERKQAAIDYDIARDEMIEAENKLYGARNEKV